MSSYTEYLISMAGGDGEPAVSADFITANRTEGGATIRQIAGSKLSAEIHLDPAQVTFVLDQLSPRTDDAERYNQRDGEPDLDQIQARADAATEGPWRLYDGKRDNRDAAVETAWAYDEDGPDTELITDWCKPADADFIAHARMDVPALLAVIRSQQARIERVRELADNAPKMQNMGGWSPGIVLASDIRAALTATEGA